MLLALALTSPTGDLIPEGNATEVEIVALYPNTVHPGNEGEFFVVSVPQRQSLAGWVFRDDGRQSAKPPPVVVEGIVAFSHHPELVTDYLDVPVYPLSGWLQLAVRGETLTVEIDGQPVDTVGYTGPAPRAHLWVRDRSSPWVALGATSFEPTSDRATVEPFVLPDSPEAVIEVLEGATDRLLLGGYQLGDKAVTDALIDAADRGVDVAVHGEGRPVGGIDVRYATALDALADAEIPVTVHRGPYARYGYHHPKYAVVDDRVLVTTENFKPSGTGGGASRGWAVVVDSPVLADALAAVFEADTGWRDAVAWETVRETIARHDQELRVWTYPTMHPPVELDDVTATLVLSPDNAEEVLIELIDGAARSIHIKQVAIGDADFPLLATAIDRARAGVTVRVLLADRWYVRDDNRALADELHALAEAEALDLEVALVDDTPTFDRIHAKGIIIDDRVAVVGSINWNNHSIRQNREVAVILEGDDVAVFYRAVFDADWPSTSTGWQLPISLLIAALAAGSLVIVHASRLRIEDPELTPIAEED